MDRRVFLKQPFSATVFFPVAGGNAPGNIPLHNPGNGGLRISHAKRGDDAVTEVFR